MPSRCYPINDNRTRCQNRQEIINCDLKLQAFKTRARYQYSRFRIGGQNGQILIVSAHTSIHNCFHVCVLKRPDACCVNSILSHPFLQDEEILI